MRSLSLAILLIGAMAVFSCQAQKYTLQNLPSKQIQWGEGGGFTGSTTSYILLENGQVFVSKSLNNNNSLKELNSIEASLAKSIFENSQGLSIDNTINRPGNIFKFISIIQGANEKSITWGEVNYACPQEIINFYNSLNAILKAE